MTSNQDAYRHPDVAAVYARESTLFPPEATILRLLGPELRNARMLDIGVGGGRTTVHFAKCVREYIGVDYSETMIRECERRFAGSSDPVSFAVCDARSMKMFPDASFDFIFFSLNAIDSVDHSDRMAILKEIRRIGKPGGWFCVSSHNLNFAARFFKLRNLVSLNPRFAKRTLRQLVVRYIFNWRIRAATLKRSPYLVISEWLHGHRFLTYYIRPEAQLRQLSESFTDIRVFTFTTGSEIREPDELRNTQEMCLHFLCRIKP